MRRCGWCVRLPSEGGSDTPEGRIHMLFALRGLGVRTAMATGAAQRTARTAKRSRATWAPAQNVYVSTTTVPFNDTVAAAGGSPLRVPGAGPLPNQPNQTPETTIQLTVRYSCTVELYARSLRSRTSPPRPHSKSFFPCVSAGRSLSHPRSHSATPCFSRSLALAPAVSLRDPVSALSPNAHLLRRIRQVQPLDLQSLWEQDCKGCCPYRHHSTRPGRL